MSIKDKVFDYIKTNGGVSFAELERIFDDEEFHWGGELVTCSDVNENVVFWCGWNAEALEVIHSLERDNLIKKEPSSQLVYLIDGKTMNLPVVKGMYDYKKEHWMPVVFNAV